MNNDKERSAADPFSSFWSDFVSRMMGSGFAAPPPDAREAMARQMRQAFFDAWARQCEEYLGSETFLEAMKKSMDGALAFRQQMSEFLTRMLHESQIPARSDTDSILLILRSLEERVLSRIDDLSQRLAALENGFPKRTPSSPEKRDRPSPKTTRKGPR